MKWLLALSLIANLFLAYRLLSAQEKRTSEKILVRTGQRPKVIEKKIYVKVPVEKKAGTSGKEEEETPAVVEYDEQDMEDQMVRVMQDKEDFLIGKLGLSPGDFEKIQNIKEKYNEKYLEVVPPDHYGDLSIEQRRRLLSLDEEREAEFAHAIGEKRWREFQQFRDNYNRRMFDKQANEKGIIVPMEI